jgi:hypothetical protein
MGPQVESALLIRGVSSISSKPFGGATVQVGAAVGAEVERDGWDMERRIARRCGWNMVARF